MDRTHFKNIPQRMEFATPYPNSSIRWAALVVLTAVLAAIFLLALMLGSVNIPLADIAAVLTGGQASKASWKTIILQFRLPKALTAALTGAALGVSGLMMQTFFRNPLAGPFVLGISSGASLGVALVVLGVGTVGGVMLAGVGVLADASLAFAAILGAGLVMGLVLLVARRIQNSMTLLVLGVMIGFLVNALVSLLLFFSIPEQIQAYINWTFGSFSGTTWSELRIMIPALVVGLLLALALTKTLNALLLNETYARTLGIDVMRARVWIIAATAILAGTVTAFCGPIAFLGVAIPHLCRSLLNTSDHRILVPATMIVGAGLALVAALIAELPGSNLVLPLNAVTATIGAPIVLAVILRRHNLDRAFVS